MMQEIEDADLELLERRELADNSAFVLNPKVFGDELLPAHPAEFAVCLCDFNLNLRRWDCAHITS